MMARFLNAIFPGLRVALLAVVIVSAVFVSLGRIMMNATAYYQQELADVLSTALKQPVSISTVAGGWEYFDAHIELKRVTIGTPAKPSILVDRIALRLSTWYSLLEWSPVFAEIDVEGVRTAVVEYAPGKWQVRGMPPGGGTLALDSILTSLSRLEAVSIDDSTVEVDTLNNDYVVSSSSKMPLRIVGQDQALVVDLPLTIEKTGEDEVSAVHLLGHVSGDPRDFEDLALDLFIRVPHLQLLDFIPPPEMADLTLAAADLAADLWLKSEDGRVDVAGIVASNEVAFLKDGKRVSAAGDMDMQFRLVSSALDEFQLTIPYIRSVVADRVIRIENIDLAATFGTDGMRLAANAGSVDIAALVRAIQRLDNRTNVLPTGARTGLDQVSPRGFLRNVGVTFSLAEGKFHLTAALDDINLDAYRGVPAISHLHGLVSISNEGGYLDLDNDNFAIQFAEIFDEPWSFTRGSGRLKFRFADGNFHIGSGLIALENGALNAVGKLQINLFPEKRYNNWGLLVSVREADLKDTPLFLPINLEDDLTEWISGAVRGGRLDQAALLMHGSLTKSASQVEKVYDMVFDVDDSQLQYHPDWPLLTDVAARLRVSNRGVFTRDASARIFSSQVTDATVALNLPRNGPAEAVLVTGQVAGGLSDGIRLLNETPLSGVTGGIAGNWRGNGSTLTNLEIRVPLGQGDVPPEVDATVRFAGNTLTMPDYDLSVDALVGDLRYRSERGLTGDGFKARLLGSPVTAKIDTLLHTHDDGESGVIKVMVDGAVEAGALYSWTDQLLVSRVSGDIPYQAELHVPFGGPEDYAFVEVTTDLIGAMVDMPPPMSKPDPQTARHFHYRQAFADDGQGISFQLDEVMGGSIRVVDGLITGGQVRFGGPLEGATAFDRLRVRGDIEEVDYTTWQAFFDGMEAAAEVSLEGELAEHLEDIRVTAGVLRIFDEQFTNADLVITREPGAWRLVTDTPQLAGTILLRDDDAAPLEIDLDHVHLAAGDTAEAADPLAAFRPQDLVPIDFSTGAFTVGGEDYGAWQFRYRPFADGAILQDVSATVRGVEIVSPATVRWDCVDGEHVTNFSGLLRVADLGPTLESWGYASSIEGSDFEFFSEINWSGSPAMVDLEHVRGAVQIGQGKGRFVQAESGTGALKLLGIFDFAKLGRRFRLDFSDVVDKGYSFSSVSGAVDFDEGLIEVADPIVIDGTGSVFKVAGTVNLETRELDNDMVVTLGVGKGLPWYAAYTAIFTSPLIGAGVLLAQKVFENQINTMSSAKYQISGTIEAPQIEFVSMFRDDVREKKPDAAGG